MTKETIAKITETRDLYYIAKEIRKARAEKDLPWLSAIDAVMSELHAHGFWLTQDESWELGDWLPEIPEI